MSKSVAYFMDDDEKEFWRSSNVGVTRHWKLRTFAGLLSWYVTSRSGQLSLLPSADWKWDSGSAVRLGRQP